MRVWEGHLGTSLEVSWEGHSEVILGLILDPFWTLSRNLMKYLKNSLHLAVGMALWLNMTKYGSLGRSGGYPV